jgi:hypothetical protein
VTTLRQIEDAIRASWGPDTVDPDDGWNPANPARGQCDVTCLVVHDMFGGEILAADVYRDGERVEGHMWNRLPGGLQLDLTREQFVDGQVVGEPVARPRLAAISEPEHPRYHRYEAYLVLAAKVRERLAAAG